MAATENISNAELRRQLRDLGEDVGPVTASTRSLYLSKLKRLKNSRETRTVLKTTVPTGVKGKAKSPSGKRSPQIKGRSSPSRKLVGFSSDEEDSEVKSPKVWKSFATERARKAREDGSRDTTSPPTDSTKIRSRRSFSNPIQDKNLGENPDQQDGGTSESDGYVYRGTPLRFLSFNLLRKRSPATQDRHDPCDERIGPKPQNSMQRQNGADGRKTYLAPLLVKLILLVTIICIVAFVFFAAKAPFGSNNTSPNPG